VNLNALRLNSLPAVFMKKVLVIGYVWPEPNSSAAGSHILSLLRLFKQQSWQIEFASPAQVTPHQINLTGEGVSQKTIRLNCDSFNDYAAAYNPEIVLFDRFMLEEQFGWRIDHYCPDAVKILDTEDLQCLRQARHHALKQSRNFLNTDLVNDIAKREIAAILRCDLSLIISPYEMTLLTGYFKVDPALLYHLPFMADLKQLSNHVLDFEQRQHFITIGNFRHVPNWDAVLYLRSLWPKIRQHLPNVECHIYGAYPPPKATALNKPEIGFLVKGWADDALSVMRQARVCLAPLRFGAGLKGKLLDAMITQTPSVTTSIGAEGMAEQHPWPGIIADNDDDFIHAAVTLYQNQTQWVESQQYCHSLLKQTYDADNLGPALITQINAISIDLKQHRLANFTGAMLKHHTLASTRYMSQWITAKNK
jgi:glycosyltransferase involved in cell wall biosynthesis